MDIRIHYSGSAGNLYRADDILLEAGVSIKKIKQALNFRLSEIRACLISHEHMDHASAVKDLMKAGIDCYMSKGTADDLQLSGHRVHFLRDKKQKIIGPWRIMPFATAHDSAEPLGFLLAKGDEKLLFVIDSNYVPHRINGLTHILIGVDFDAEILKEHVMSGMITLPLANRILKNHMSIQTAEDFFRINDMSKVQEIYLLHLSSINSDPEQFRDAIETITGRPVSPPVWRRGLKHTG